LTDSMPFACRGKADSGGENAGVSVTSEEIAAAAMGAGRGCK
jgi:hypothetical protein